MKKLKIFIVAMMTVIMSSFSMNAEIPMTTNYDGNAKFTDNWSIGIDEGIQTNLYDWNNPQGGIVGLNLNKQLTPVFGLSLNGYVGFNNTGNWLNSTHFHNKNVTDNIMAFVDGRWNVINTFAGYKGKPRFFEIETVAGFGYGHFFNNHTVMNDWNSMLFKAGLNLNFNITSDRAWTINVKPVVIWDLTNSGRYASEAINSHYAVFQVTAGVTYNFKSSNKKHYINESPVDYYVNRCKALNDKINQLQEQLETQPVEVRTTAIVDTVYIEHAHLVETTYVVTFAFNSNKLSEQACEILNKIPNNADVTIDGYASPEGSETYNYGLSERRANAVADYLKEHNVNITRVSSHGAECDESNRIVIIHVH